MMNNEVYDAIQRIYFDLMHRDCSMTNVTLFVSPRVGEALGLGDRLTIGFGQFQVDVPVVVDDTIVETELESGWKSDLFLYSPDLA